VCVCFQKAYSFPKASWCTNSPAVGRRTQFSRWCHCRDQAKVSCLLQQGCWCLHPADKAAAPGGSCLRLPAGVGLLRVVMTLPVSCTAVWWWPDPADGVGGLRAFAEGHWKREALPGICSPSSLTSGFNFFAMADFLGRQYTVNNSSPPSCQYNVFEDSCPFSPGASTARKPRSSIKFTKPAQPYLTKGLSGSCSA